MQEYVEERTVAISVKAGKLSGRALAAACKKVLAEMKSTMRRQNGPTAGRA